MSAKSSAIRRGVGADAYGRRMVEKTRDALFLLDRTSCRRGLPRSQRAATDEEDQETAAGIIRRSDTGDVVNMRAFNKRMAEVGEEDQSIPGWDSLP